MRIIEILDNHETVRQKFSESTYPLSHWQFYNVFHTPGQIEKAIRIFLSTASKINKVSILSRKNFFFYAIFLKKRNGFFLAWRKNLS